MADYTKLKASLQETIKERNDLKAVANEYGVNIENSTPFVEYHNFFDDKLNENSNEIKQISQELQGKIEEYNNLNAEYAEYTNDVNEVKDDLKTVANNSGGAITEQTPFREYSSEFERVIGDKYDKGKADGEKSERDRFWNSFLREKDSWTNSGLFSGVGWRDSTFKPPFDMTFITQCMNMFNISQITDIVSSLEQCGVTFTFRNVTSANSMYAYAITKRTVPMQLLNCSMVSTFAYCSKLITIGKLTLSGSENWVNTFSNSPNIENIELEGVIGKNGFNVQWSTKLTKASLLNILNCLKDYSSDTSGTVWTVTLGNENKAKLTAEELKIAENKGWRVV